MTIAVPESDNILVVMAESPYRGRSFVSNRRSVQKEVRGVYGERSTSRIRDERRAGVRRATANGSSRQSWFQDDEPVVGGVRVINAKGASFIQQYCLIGAVALK